MPLILVHNAPRVFPVCFSATILCLGLRNAAASAGFPGLTSPHQVTVTLASEQVVYEDDKLVLIVEGLFDTLDRTLDVRRNLAERLNDAARACLPIHWGCEVIIKRFDPSKDAYFASGFRMMPQI